MNLICSLVGHRDLVVGEWEETKQGRVPHGFMTLPGTVTRTHQAVVCSRLGANPNPLLNPLLG